MVQNIQKNKRIKKNIQTLSLAIGGVFTLISNLKAV